MQDYIELSGIILKTSNLSEYDKRLVVLTNQRGKITVFARGVRRPHSKFLAACEPFVLGKFKLFPGKEAYSFLEVTVDNYFEPLRHDINASCLGMYFLEVADYYTRENNDDLQMMKLLYVSLLALSKGNIPAKLIRCVYEMKAIMINGEFPGIVEGMHLSESAAYTINFILKTAPEKLYCFTVQDAVLDELVDAAAWYRSRFMGGNFKTLEILDVLQ